MGGGGEIHSSIHIFLSNILLKILSLSFISNILNLFLKAFKLTLPKHFFKAHTFKADFRPLEHIFPSKFIME